MKCLSVALRNLAVEQEFFKQADAALKSYQKATAVAQQYLGRQHSISMEIANDFTLAKEVCTNDFTIVT